MAMDEVHAHASATGKLEVRSPVDDVRFHTGVTGKLGPKVYIVCNQSDTAPAWGYILRQKGLHVSVETSVERAVEHWTDDVPDVTILDVNASHEERMELCRSLRGVSAGPLLLFLPVHNENEILEAYGMGVDDCVVKPISPAVFLAKVIAWAQRSWTVPVEGVRPTQTMHWMLEPATRSLISESHVRVILTNLEFRLLNQLMSRPGQVVPNEELVRIVWGNYGHGDEVLLKNVVYRLRKKLDAAGDRSRPLRTWQGGYSFNDTLKPE